MTLMTSSVGAGPLPPLQAVLVGGARLFTADAVAGASKAEAVRVMQRYESSLRNSSHQVVPAQPEGTRPRMYEVDGPEGATSAAAVTGGEPAGGRGVGGGVPWSRLVGGATPGLGGLVGADPVRSVLAAESAALSDLAARRATGTGGFFSPGMGARPVEDEDKNHKSRLPNVDNGLFALDQRPSAAVIGDLTNRGHDSGS
jgi:hypothetical protein